MPLAERGCPIPRAAPAHRGTVCPPVLDDFVPSLPLPAATLDGGQVARESERVRPDGALPLIILREGLQ